MALPKPLKVSLMKGHQSLRYSSSIKRCHEKIRRQREGIGIMKSLKMEKEFTSELSGEDFNRDKERPAAFLKLKVRR